MVYNYFYKIIHIINFMRNYTFYSVTKKISNIYHHYSNASNNIKINKEINFIKVNQFF